MKRIMILLTVLSLMILAACSGNDPAIVTTAQPSAAAEEPAPLPPERRLQITATIEDGLGFTSFSPEEIGGGLTENLSYLDLKDVCITLGDSVYPLEEALREGMITVEEIFAYARLDARNKLCGERHETENGLTHFTYCYPEFYVHLVYDVLEAPDGTDHLISDICIYQPGSNIGFFYVDDETGIPLTREDWGLSFEVVDATPTGITFNCTQSGGQQIGTLEAGFYHIYTEDYQESAPRLSDVINDMDAPPVFTVPNDTKSQFTVDWTQLYGELPSGSYILSLYIQDVFTEDQVHPLMKDFSAKQTYDIAFIIP